MYKNNNTWITGWLVEHVDTVQTRNVLQNCQQADDSMLNCSLTVCSSCSVSINFLSLLEYKPLLMFPFSIHIFDICDSYSLKLGVWRNIKIITFCGCYKHKLIMAILICYRWQDNMRLLCTLCCNGIVNSLGIIIYGNSHSLISSCFFFRTMYSFIIPVIELSHLAIVILFLIHSVL